MANIMDSELKDKIIGNINSVVNEVFTNYFGVNVSPDNKNALPTKGCLCQVHMKQEGVNMFLCFNFDANLLCSLVDGAYGDGEVIKNPEPYKDAACEIANIVCCRVKAMLNDNGYKLNMEIPYPTDSSKRDSIQYKDSINMHYSVNNKVGFSVDLLASENIK